MYAGIFRRLLASSATIALVICNAPSSGQSPQGPVVAAGSITVTRQGATTLVTQGTDKGVIDWRSFSVGATEAVRFDQPGRSSVTLNRVTGAELSRIDGNLSATGQVWLANPNGVLIGPSGQINLGGLLMTTGRVDAPEFLRSGKALIDHIPSQAGVANSGVVSIAEGGYAALAAAAIRNDGVIIARAGSVALGAGRAMTVDFVGDKLIQFQVTQPLDQAPAGADALIKSSGKIMAEGGAVAMSARAAKGVMNNVINLSGHVVANAVRVDGGTVTFGDGGTVQVSARIDASSAIGRGGAVAVLGENVGLMDGASIDASGATGGGAVSIGGDWQGKGPNQNALVTYVAPTASIRAEGNQSGKGGKVAVWADDTTRFNGRITAQGGAVETSGKKTLQVGPAAVVKAGSWLLDPTNITIQSSGGGPVTGTAPTFFFSPASSSNISDSTIVAALANGDVTIQTSGGSGGSGDITVAGGANVDFNGGVIRRFALLADRDINFSSGSRLNLTGAAHNIVLNARAAGGAVGAITIDNAVGIATSGGSVSLVGGVGGTGFAVGRSGNQTGVEFYGTISVSGGAVTIRGQGAAGVAGANGIRLDSAKIDAGVGGSISVAGVAGDLCGVGVKIVSSDLLAPGGGLTLVSDSLSVAPSRIDLTGGSLTVQASSPSTSIGVYGAAGGLQLPASLFAGISGTPSSITIGRSDQTAPINIAAGLVLSADMTFQTGGGSIAFAGAVNAAAASQQSLTVSSGSGATLLGGAIGLGAALQNLSITSIGGDVVQSGAISVAGVVSISAGSAVLSDPANLIHVAALTLTGPGLSQIATNAPVLTIAASTVVGGLAITTHGDVAQIGPLAAGSLALLGSGGVYALTDPGNQIGTLAANTASVVLSDAAVGGLSLGAVGATTGVTATGSAAIKTAGPLSGLVAVGSGSLTIEAQGGAITAVVGGSTGLAAASAVLTPTGHVTVNGKALSSLVAIAPPPILPDAVVAAVFPTKTLPPPLVDVSVLPIIVVAPVVAGVPAAAPLVVVQVVAPVKSADVANDLPPLEMPEASGLGVRVEALELDALQTEVARTQPATAPASEQEPFAATGNIRADAKLAHSADAGRNMSAESLRTAFATTLSGMLLPGTPSSVGETGQVLISTRTVKIDAADAGGEGGQVVYGGGALRNDGFPGLPNQLWEVLTLRRAQTLAEPLLSDQPATLNEEALID